MRSMEVVMNRYRRFPAVLFAHQEGHLSNQGVQKYEGDAKIKMGPKPKRIRLSEGKKLTLEALPILHKGEVSTKGVAL